MTRCDEHKTGAGDALSKVSCLQTNASTCLASSRTADAARTPFWGNIKSGLTYLHNTARRRALASSMRDATTSCEPSH
jgi:hypothetical protein